jgi:hypothetical protein
MTTAYKNIFLALAVISSLSACTLKKASMQDQSAKPADSAESNADTTNQSSPTDTTDTTDTADTQNISAEGITQASDSDSTGTAVGNSDGNPIGNPADDSIVDANTVKAQLYQQVIAEMATAMKAELDKSFVPLKLSDKITLQELGIQSSTADAKTDTETFDAQSIFESLIGNVDAVVADRYLPLPIKQIYVVKNSVVLKLVNIKTLERVTYPKIVCLNPETTWQVFSRRLRLDDKMNPFTDRSYKAFSITAEWDRSSYILEMEIPENSPENPIEISDIKVTAKPELKKSSLTLSLGQKNAENIFTNEHLKSTSSLRLGTQSDTDSLTRRTDTSKFSICD